MVDSGNDDSSDKVSIHNRQMRELIRIFDWSKTSLGSPDTWPQSLRTSVNLLLDTYSAMSVIWGADYIQLYNDRYRPILGTTKHPAALGRSARENFPEIWHIIAPLFEMVMQGQAIGADDWMVPLDRNGYLEECYFTYSYNPIRVENDTVGGILVIVIETTDRVLNDRRLVTLRDLAANTEPDLTEDRILQVALNTLKNNAADIPFGLLYKVNQEQFELIGTSADFSDNKRVSPLIIQSEDDDPWALRLVRDSHQTSIIEDVQTRVGVFSSGTWPEPITKAIALPIMELGKNEVYAVLVIGINPRHALDEKYENFLHLVVGQITSAVNKVFAARELKTALEAQLQVIALRGEVLQAERDAQAAIENIIESITDPFYAIDPDERFVYVNASLRTLWGKTHDELIGHKIWDVFSPVTPALIQVQERLQRAAAENRPQTLELYSSTTNQWWDLSIYPSSSGVAVYFQDITARKETERLREQLELVLDNIDGGFLIFDQQRRHVYLNKDAAELAFKATGLTRDQLIGVAIETGFPDIVKSRLFHELNRSMTEQVAIVFDTYVDLLNIWVEYQIYPSLEYVAVFVVDITHRKQEEAERAQLDTLLETERQRLANIMATVPGVIWENAHTDEHEEMKLVFISAYVETMLGYTVAEALAEPHFWLKIFHPDDAQQTFKAFYRVRQSGGSGIVNFRAIHKNGRLIHVQALMITVIKDDKPVGKRGVMMDVSERQQLINAQSRYATMLRRSNEELQQFAYVASHDLQEPLRMVTSYLQILENRYANQLDNDAREFIGFAVDGAARMKALINDLLAYSRVEGSEKNFEEFDAQLALDKALANLGLNQEDNPAIITADAMPRIKADSTQIVQLFQNLIGNAVKFQQGSVPRVHIGVEDSKDYWQFWVRDNGIGIAPQYLDRIFVIFQRLHRKNEYPGTGIGLAICKKVVERHGGRIWVESTVGEGTTFYFTLPIS